MISFEEFNEKTAKAFKIIGEALEMNRFEEAVALAACQRALIHCLMSMGCEEAKILKVAESVSEAVRTMRIEKNEMG